MSNKAIPISSEPTRRRLTERQAETVQLLATAALEELEQHGHTQLTVRNAARRAGVAPATAYNYFSSKEHLVAEIYWRRIRELPELAPADGRSAAERTVQVILDIASALADEPELAAAANAALLAPDPDVKHLRELIGAEIRRRLKRALGKKVDASVLLTIEFILSGAIVRAATGHCTYDELPAHLERSCNLVLATEATPKSLRR